ncbi:MAG: ATP-binding protein, partial [Betaproteobacteria bacterium]|nr:ATP-binding protein [Betaproteobacteria bacterium]
FNRKGGNVVIETRRHDGNLIRISITDTGVGIAAEEIPLLFRPFERIDMPQRAIDGAGIGLALSANLAALMGATLGVESTPGKGSTFWVDLRS